jgi:hypothetical protein
MPRADPAQFNIRSGFARARAHELARLTGRSVTEIVEDALRSYAPPVAALRTGRLVQRGVILVQPADGGFIGQDEAHAALNAVRERSLEGEDSVED